MYETMVAIMMTMITVVIDAVMTVFVSINIVGQSVTVTINGSVNGVCWIAIGRMN